MRDRYGPDTAKLLLLLLLFFCWILERYKSVRKVAEDMSKYMIAVSRPQQLRAHLASEIGCIKHNTSWSCVLVSTQYFRRGGEYGEKNKIPLMNSVTPVCLCF